MKIKKIFKIFVILLFVFTFNIKLNFSSGDTIEVNESVFDKDKIDKLNKIGVRFCNNGLNERKLTKDLKIETNPGKKEPLCIIFFNISKEPITIVPGFSISVKDSNGADVCKGDPGEKNSFSDMIESDRILSELTIKGGDKIIKQGNINIPKNTNGEKNGCLMYRLAGKEEIEKDKMFLIVSRIGIPIKLNITGNVYNYQRLDNTKYFIQDNKQLILKIITGIILLRLIISIIEQMKKKKHHKNKKK